MWFALSIALAGAAGAAPAIRRRIERLGRFAALLDGRLREGGMEGIGQAVAFYRSLGEVLAGVDAVELERAVVEARALGEVLAPVAHTLSLLRQIKAAVGEAERRW